MEKPDSNLSRTLLVGLVIGLVLGGAIGYLASSLARGPLEASSGEDVDIVGALSTEEVGVRVEAFINENLLQPGLTAEVKKLSEKNGVYEVMIELNTPQGPQNAHVFVSKDGTLLFLQPPIDMSAPLPLPPGNAGTAAQPAEEIDMGQLIDDDPWAGSKEAKVVIVEFSDFQCPFCARAFATVKQIKDTYGDRILFVYRDFPLSSIHPEAQKAAEAAECADDQGRFWEYHDLLFEKQEEWSGVGTPKFMEYAASIGLDSEAFNDCLSSGKYSEEVSKDLRDGTGVGVTGTPAFFVNGRLISGAQPFSVFQKAIDEELAKTG